MGFKITCYHDFANYAEVIVEGPTEKSDEIIKEIDEYLRDRNVTVHDYRPEYEDRDPCDACENFTSDGSSLCAECSSNPVPIELDDDDKAEIAAAEMSAADYGDNHGF